MAVLAALGISPTSIAARSPTPPELAATNVPIRERSLTTAGAA
ncbi:hypothetical protein [Arthrobacter terrae]|nr:hypothetical protein [Arthrobacter terrae]